MEKPKRKRPALSHKPLTTDGLREQAADCKATAEKFAEHGDTKIRLHYLSMAEVYEELARMDEKYAKVEL